MPCGAQRSTTQRCDVPLVLQTSRQSSGMQSREMSYRRINTLISSRLELMLSVHWYLTYSALNRLQAVDFSGDAKRLLTGCNDKGIRCWDVGSTEAPVVTMTGHTGSIKKAIFDTTEQLCISGGDDKSMRCVTTVAIFFVFSFPLWLMLSTPWLVNSSVPLCCLSCTHHRRQALTSRQLVFFCRVWDIRTGSEVKRVDLNAAVTSMELSRDGSTLTTTHGSTVGQHCAGLMTAR